MVGHGWFDSIKYIKWLETADSINEFGINANQQLMVKLELVNSKKYHLNTTKKRHCGQAITTWTLNNK
jgi:hypothetical protein